MKNILVAVAAVLLCLSAAAQKKEEVLFSDPYQIDSSDYFLVPRMIDDLNAAAYGKGKGYLPWGNYSDIVFYNSETNQSKKLFGDKLALINTFSQRRNYYYYDESREKEIPANILRHHIIYLVRTENFNNDGGLDTDDPVYLYISTKTGDNLRQITPGGFHVLSWTVSKDQKMILVKGQNDKNGNKKFGQGDDQLYYRIDLEDDVSKIRCYPLNF
ncbi:MAG TPA: hypothetical protein PK092_02525 [Chitinophagaceae bacterium]|nr:hypothetical protein [Chitinophagaceae bacterium]